MAVFQQTIAPERLALLAPLNFCPCYRLISPIFLSKISPNSQSYRFCCHCSLLPLTPSDWWSSVTKASTNLSMLVNAIQTGEAIGVTGSSFKNNFGTAAFTLQAADNNTNNVLLVNQTPGWESMDSYWEKLADFYGIIMVVDPLCTSFAIPSRKVVIACDFDSVLDNLFSWIPPHPSKSHYDLLYATQKALCRSPMDNTPHKIMAHQDDYIMYASLDPQACLNMPQY